MAILKHTKIIQINKMPIYECFSVMAGVQENSKQYTYILIYLNRTYTYTYKYRGTYIYTYEY